VQATNGEPSSEHWKLAPASFELKVKVAAALTVVRSGPDSIVVSGRVTSGGGGTNPHSYSAAEASTFPAPSMATTVNVCVPSASPVYSTGEVQTLNAAPSRLHW
jgi:hypothetical protein